MKGIQKIALIGSGNVATVLGRTLKSKGFTIAQVYSRTKESAHRLAKTLACAYTNDLKKITRDADLYIIAVKDDAIAKVASQLRLKEKTVVHTSGSIPMDILKKVSGKTGVLYPPHGFKKKDTLQKGIPFCIEYSDRDVKSRLDSIVKALGGKAYYMNSEQRAKLHLAAVFANNFTNHMWTIADNLLSKAKISPKLLTHLAEDIFAKLKVERPALHQTGPASRRDKGIMEKHEKMLRQYPHEYLEIYKLLSKSIMRVMNGK